jgi:hypothetical protein
MKELEVKCFFGVNRDNHDNTSVFEVVDDKTRKKIISIKFTAEHFTQLMGRMGNVSGEAILLENEHYKDLGKKRIVDYLSIPVDDNYETRGLEAIKAAEKLVKSFSHDWEVVGYLDSRDSFYELEGQTYARVKIIRYK